MRCWKQYLMESGVDLCAMTETHFDQKKEKLFHQMFEDEYEIVTKIRRNRKRRDYGSGGVAVVVRKGNYTIAKAKKTVHEDVLWVEVKGMARRIFIAVVYIVPLKSSRYYKNGALRRELEEDIVNFGQKGMVVVLGDLNSRIGEGIVREGMDLTYQRVSKDKVKNDNGREWIKLTRNTGMVTLTGLYGQADYTC